MDSALDRKISRRIYADPSVTLVGAGPGDPELISLKGIKALKRADVVLYDALVHPALLDHTPVDCTRVFVGNPSGDECFSQEVVNQLMVDYALNFGHVVRLKGGDLFVFGKGYEELEYAASYSIPTSIVPGISSAISVPGLQGIPVTHNGLSHGLSIVTALDADGDISKELKHASQGASTVVVLLGYGDLDRIVKLYQRIGKGRLPAAVIQNGSMPDERVAVGLVNTIEEAVEEVGIDGEGPCLLVFGDAVGVHPAFQPIRDYFADQEGFH